MALELRAPLDLEAPPVVPELAEHLGPKGALSINPRNRAYPIVVATVLDALEAAEGSYAKAARALGLTTSQVLRFLRSDPQVWRAVEEGGRPQGAPAGRPRHEGRRAGGETHDVIWSRAPTTTACAR